MVVGGSNLSGCDPNVFMSLAESHVVCGDVGTGEVEMGDTGEVGSEFHEKGSIGDGEAGDRRRMAMMSEGR